MWQGVGANNSEGQCSLWGRAFRGGGLGFREAIFRMVVLPPTSHMHVMVQTLPSMPPFLEVRWVRVSSLANVQGFCEGEMRCCLYRTW